MSGTYSGRQAFCPRHSPGGWYVQSETDPDTDYIVLHVGGLDVWSCTCQDWARRSEERIATLGTFESVAISLEDPEVPQRDKRVIVTVVEQPSQYLDPRIGFSTGEGLRFAFEYGHKNIAGEATADGESLLLAEGVQ